MAVSFVTRFRRHLATIPFVIVALLPIAAVAIYVARDGDAAESVIAPVTVGGSVERLCLEADSIAEQLDVCPDSQGAE